MELENEIQCSKTLDLLSLAIQTWQSEIRTSMEVYSWEKH